METSKAICPNQLVFKKTSGMSLLTAYSEGLIHGSHLDFKSLHFNSQHNPSGQCQHSHAWKNPRSHYPTHCHWRKPEAVNLANIRVCSHSARRIIGRLLKHKMCTFLIEWLLKMLFGSAEVPSIAFPGGRMRDV